jgi:hypothetical protein
MRAKNDTWEISWSIVHCTSYPSTFCAAAALLNLLSEEQSELESHSATVQEIPFQV